MPPDQQVRQIIEAAANYLAETPFDQFRLVQLAKSLGMSHSNIYRFFDSKEALFDAVIDQWLQASRELVMEVLEKNGTALERLSMMLIAIHESSREKLEHDPIGYSLYEHLWTARSKAANAHKAFIMQQGIQLLAEAIQNEEVAIRDPLKAAVLVQAATTKFLTPELVKNSLEEDTTAQMRTVLDAVFLSLRFDPHCLDLL